MPEQWLPNLIETVRDAARVVVLLLLVALPASILMLHVHNQYQVTRLGYDIAQATKAHRRLMEDNRKLRIEAAVQGRTERMTLMARDRFGLEPARHDQIILIDPSRAAGAEHAALTLSR